MGKALIKSGGSAGQYEIELILHRERVEAEIATLETGIAELTIIIDDLAAGTEKDAAIFTRATKEVRLKYLTDNVPVNPVVTAWCADLTEDLTGYVGTIEVPGERAGVPVLIRPGYLGAAVYDVARDGQLQPVLGGTPASVFYNLALHPGWQKWQPTYRLGEITELSGDNCSVAIDAATFSDRGSGLAANLNVNQDTVAGLVTLTTVPIEYRECNGKAFEVGDRVVVAFTAQDWAQPKVIGFESNPQSCEFPYILIKISGRWLNIDEYFTNPALVVEEAVDDQYLAWDYDKNIALQVTKSGGGFWEYPVSAADYDGFIADLDSMFYGIYLTSFDNLFSAASPVFTLINPTVPADGYYIFNPAGPNNYSVSVPAIPTWFDYDELWSLSSYAFTGDYVDVIGPDNQSESSSAINSYGLTDYYSGQMTINGTVTKALSNPAIASNYEKIGVYNIELLSEFSLSYTAAVGSIADRRYSRMIMEFSDLAERDIMWVTPATTNCVAITVNNGPGTDIISLGPEIVWSFTGSKSELNEMTWDADPANYNYADATSFAGRVELSGIGTLLSSISNFSYTATSDATIILDVTGGYGLPNTIDRTIIESGDFARSQITITGGYSTVDNLMAYIVFETISAGDYSHTYDGAPEYSLVSADCNSLIACAVVEDAANHNPFELSENETLKAAIDAIVAANFLFTWPGSVYQYLELNGTINRIIV